MRERDLTVVAVSVGPISYPAAISPRRLPIKWTSAIPTAWIVDRLARCGQRSVSPLVDISNYVMFELGRPSHIFDHAKIHDELVIRWARGP